MSYLADQSVQNVVVTGDRCYAAYVNTRCLTEITSDHFTGTNSRCVHVSTGSNFDLATVRHEHLVQTSARLSNSL